MIEHGEIIKKLNLPQKAKIISDLTANNSDLGVPYLKMKRFWSDSDLEVKNLANCWNDGLWSELAFVEANKSSDKRCAFLLPESYLLTDDRFVGVSEDSHLTKSFNDALVKGAYRAGSVPITDGLTADKDKLGLFGIRYEEISACAAYDGVDLDDFRSSNIFDLGGNSDEDYKKYLFETTSRVSSKDKVVFKGLKGADFIKAIANGFYLFTDCEPYAIQKAVETHNDLAEKEPSIQELAFYEGKGETLSEETLDRAIDKLISFIESRAFSGEEKNDGARKRELFETAAEESFVLLKNDGVLPFGKNDEVCFIGREGVVGSFGNCSFKAVGELGDLKDSDEDIEKYRKEAISLCSRAKTVVYFMQNRPVDEEMIDTLNRLNKKIVVAQECSPKYGVNYEDKVNAIIYEPKGRIAFSETLCKILGGEISPSGALPFSIYKDPADYFSRIKEDVEEGAIKTGTLIGYKRYTTDDDLKDEVAFPFGYGISYCKIEYSPPQIKGDNLVFTIKNKSKRECKEIFQVFGRSESSFSADPARELLYFSKKSIGAGQNLDISIPLKDIVDGIPTYSRENGNYSLTVRSFSGSEIGEVIAKTTKPLGNNYKKGAASDYLYGSSNVVGADQSLPVLDYKKATRKKHKFIKFLLFASALTIAVLIANCFIDFIGTTGYLSYNVYPFRNMPWAVFIIAAAVALLSIIILLIGARYSYGYALKEQDMPKTKIYDVKGVDETELENIFYKEISKNQIKKDDDSLFTDEDDVVTEDSEEKEDVIGVATTVNSLCKGFAEFAEKNGVKLAERSAATLISAVASSRLIALTANGLNKRIVDLLQAYFGGGTSVYKAEDLIVGDKNAPDFMPFAFFSGNKSDVSSFVKQFGDFFKNNGRAGSLTFQTSAGSVTGKIAEGARVFVCFENGIGGLSPSIVQDMALISLNARETAVSETKPQTFPIGCFYLDRAVKGALKENFMEEKYWKYLDSYAERQDAVFGNKQFVRVEAFTSCLLECGIDDAEVFDEAVSAFILPAIKVAAKKAGEAKEELRLTFGADALPIAEKTADALENTEA